MALKRINKVRASALRHSATTMRVRSTPLDARSLLFHSDAIGPLRFSAQTLLIVSSAHYD